MKKHLYILIMLVLMTYAAVTLYQLHNNEITTQSVSFSSLPSFKETKLAPSFEAFKNSCRIFLKKSPDTKVGSQFLHLTAKDWQGVCHIAMNLNHPSEANIHHFFESQFQAIAFSKGGLFTGYYLPLIKGSLKKTSKYPIPLYGKPNDLIKVDLSQFKPNLNQKIMGRLEDGQLVPYHTRKQIHEGAIKNKADVIAYVHNNVDRIFLEIQGSGVIKLNDGKQIFVSYVAENGYPYTPIGKVLVQKGVMTPQTASMQSIRAYLEAHPEIADDIINENTSFVFFRQLPIKSFNGAQGAPLTPGYSLAIDRQYLPMGAPVWLTTTYPTPNGDAKLNRLMIAQDTGGAIKGPVRGDVYWGAGKDASYIAGHMKNQGHYWMLVPKHLSVTKKLNF